MFEIARLATLISLLVVFPSDSGAGQRGDNCEKELAGSIWSHIGETADLPVKMSLLFRNDGQLIFRGGFVMYNPASWSCSDHRKEMVMKVSHLSNASIRILNDQMARNRIKSFDIDDNEIVYDVVTVLGERKLSFMSYFFFDERSPAYREIEEMMLGDR